MEVTNITAANQAAQSAKYATDSSSQELDMDDFFKLLTVQLTSQDPLKPMEDTEFISQMTSFSSLSEMENIAADMKSLREQQSSFSAQSLLGRQVSATTQDGVSIEGVVTRVMREGENLVPYVGAQRVPLINITEISS